MAATLCDNTDCKPDSLCGECRESERFWENLNAQSATLCECPACASLDE